jgi:hypothetical protein
MSQELWRFSNRMSLLLRNDTPIRRQQEGFCRAPWT